MGKPHSIPPFPADIDRDRFGWWLSGFVAGEGCFLARILRRCGKCDQPQPRFTITLRADDRAALHLIRSYWQCGSVTGGRKYGHANPLVCYSVHRVENLERILVPHFQRFPLLAKKSSDFPVWRRAVHLCWLVSQRPLKTAGGFGKGFLPKWTEDEREEYQSLVLALRVGRKFAGSEV